MFLKKNKLLNSSSINIFLNAPLVVDSTSLNSQVSVPSYSSFFVDLLSSKEFLLPLAVVAIAWKVKKLWWDAPVKGHLKVEKENFLSDKGIVSDDTTGSSVESDSDTIDSGVSDSDTIGSDTIGSGVSDSDTISTGISNFSISPSPSPYPYPYSGACNFGVNPNSPELFGIPDITCPEVCAADFLPFHGISFGVNALADGTTAGPLYCPEVLARSLKQGVFDNILSIQGGMVTLFDKAFCFGSYYIVKSKVLQKSLEASNYYESKLKIFLSLKTSLITHREILVDCYSRAEMINDPLFKQQIIDQAIKNEEYIKQINELINSCISRGHYWTIFKYKLDALLIESSLPTFRNLDKAAVRIFDLDLYNQGVVRVEDIPIVSVEVPVGAPDAIDIALLLISSL